MNTSLLIAIATVIVVICICMRLYINYRMHKGIVDGSFNNVDYSRDLFISRSTISIATMFGVITGGLALYTALQKNEHLTVRSSERKL